VSALLYDGGHYRAAWQAETAETWLRSTQKITEGNNNVGRQSDIVHTELNSRHFMLLDSVAGQRARVLTSQNFWRDCREDIYALCFVATDWKPESAQ
jgi:hypothetical protein